MAIPPRFLDELRSRITLSDIIGKRVKIMRAGREFKACCPFHNEKSPSFTINDDKHFYHCFGCGAHGDSIGFLMQHDNLTFIEAVEQLAALAGMAVPEQSPQEIQKAKEQKGLYELLEDTTKWFTAQLYDPKHKVQLDYMRERGVSADLMNAFRIGFAPADGDALYKYLKGLDYKDHQMLEAGVVKESTRGGSPYAFFRDRIIFPVTDRRGRVVAFGGRILPDHLRPPDRGDFKPPKYINSSDTPLFHKGRMLFGESHARQAAADDQPIIVVEGYLDVMACYDAGYRGAVAPLGTALTEEQIAVLWKMIPSREKVPILCFDGDNAGRRAAKRAADNILPLLQPDHSALIAFLPEGQDPDSLIKAEGKSALAAVLAGAVPLVDFVWQAQTEGLSFATPESRAGLEKALDDQAARIADRTVQQYYKTAFREKLRAAFAPPPRSYDRQAGGYQGGGYNNNYGGNNFGGNRGGRRGAPLPPPVPLSRPASAMEKRCRILLAILINHPEVCAIVEEEAGMMNMANEELDFVRQIVLNLRAEDPDLDADGVRNHLKERGFAAITDMILSERDVYIHAGFARAGGQTALALDGWRGIVEQNQRDNVIKEAAQNMRQSIRDGDEEGFRRAGSAGGYDNERDE